MPLWWNRERQLHNELDRDASATGDHLSGDRQRGCPVEGESGLGVGTGTVPVSVLWMEQRARRYAQPGPEAGTGQTLTDGRRLW